MEFYGSIDSVSGSITASFFTGSFVGDAEGLYNIQASGVTGLNLSQIASGNATASISSTGFTVNKNTNIVGNLSVTGSIIANEYIVSSSVIYMTTSFASGSSAFGNDENDVHQFTGSVEITGSISLNGEPIGTGKLNETTFNSYTSSTDGRIEDLETSTGSLNTFTSSIDMTIKSKLDTEDVISGSIQIELSGTTGFSTFSSSVSTSLSDVSSSIGSLSSSVDSSIGSLSSSIGSLSSSVATTDYNQDGRLTSIEGKTGSYATTGSNLFKGDQTLSGSVIPSVDNFYDLGSPTHQWKDVYISSGSLYIDGSKVLSSTTQELTITTDNGQSIKILEGTTDSIVLQTADGNIELKSSAAGDILLDPTDGKITLKGPVEILSGQKIQSSVGGTPVVFANDIVVSGSIDLTGTIDGIDLSSFSSSVDGRFVSIEGTTGSLNTFTSSINTTIKSKLDSDGVVSGSSQIVLSGTTGFSTVSASLSSLSSSISITNFNQDERLNGIETSTGSLNTFTSSINTTIKSKLDTDSVISGSVQVNITGTTGYSTFSSSLSSSVNDLSSSVSVTTSGLSSSIGDLSSSIATTDSNQNDRLNSIETKSGSFATTGSNTFVGSQIVSGSVTIRENLLVLGSSSITYTTSSQLRVNDNVITVNTSNPAERFGGLQVYDSGSLNEATGSLFWDSEKNRWVYQQSSEATYGGGVLLSGPRSSGSLGDELTLTSGKIARSAGGDHLNDSIITEYNGTTIGISGSLVITGSIESTTTTLVSGSSQISYTGLSNVPTGIVSGSSQITYSSVSGIPTGIVSGSSQVIALLPAGTVSGSSQVLSGTGIWSGSAQLPAGTVSGSSQIDFGSISSKPALVSGSSQISYSGLTGIPTGIVSGSSQVVFSSLSGVPVGLVSGSSQVLGGTGIVSGSSQITFGSVSGIPGGLVSGSSQIDLTSTTNYASGILTRLNAVGVFSGSAQVTGIGNSQLTNSSFYVGTTSISLGRGSASQTLTGVSIDGNAATVTGGVYTSGDQTIAGTKTFSGTISMGSATRQMLNLWGTQYGLGIQSSTFYFRTDGRFSWYNGGTHSDTENTAGTGGSNLMTLTSSGNLTVSGTVTASGGNSSNWNTAYGWGNHSSAGYQTSSGTVAYASYLNALTNYSWASSTLPNSYHQGITSAFVGPSEGWQNYGSVMTMRTYSGGGGTLQMYTPYGPTNGGTSLQVRFGDYSAGGNAWTGWKTLIDSGTIGSQSVSYASTAGNITAYTINQSVGTGNSPTFAGLTVNFSGTDQGVTINKVSGGSGNWNYIGFANGGTRRGYMGTDSSGYMTIGSDISQIIIQNNTNITGNFIPSSNNSYNLGSASLGWANVYTNDLHLSNMNKPEGNDIDGTNGTWTIQEGAENLYIINNNNGKKYKIDLTEII